MHPDGRVVVFHIPARPKGTAYHLDGQYLMRSAQELVPLSEDRLRGIFAEGQPDWLGESAGSVLSADEVVDRLDTQTYFQLLQLPYPARQEGVIDRLLADRLIDGRPNGYSLRRLGALLLAKRLGDFAELARKAPRVIVYNGKDKLEPRLDQTSAKGYAVGFQGLVRFILDQLPRNEILQDALRKEVVLVPEGTIRELVANALIHQDFLVAGSSVVIEIHRNRVEFTSTGEPIVPVDRFIDGYQSRNERLADLMRRMRICKERSSGIDRVVSTAEVLQLPAPDFRTAHRRTEAILYGPRPFEAVDRDDRIRACHQHCVLRWVMKERMTNQSLREPFKLPEPKSVTVFQVISATIDAGQIRADESVGSSRKFARYLPSWA